MLAAETQRAMMACRSSWGIYIQADEVFADGAALEVRAAIERNDGDRTVEGALVEYRHFYGGFDTIVRNRKWYRREVRAVRLDPALAVHSHRDAQGFRAGPDDRRIRAVASGAVMYHYGWARPPQALAAKRSEDRTLDPARRQALDGRPLLPWIPGIEPFGGEHPAVAREWIAARRSAENVVGLQGAERQELRLAALDLLDRWTGWRMFEFRNYVEVPGASSPRA
jgi:hypothetical protein